MLQRRFLIFTILLIFISSPLLAQSIQQFAELGDFRLENGQIIQDCRIGYRTFGALNAEKSNAILFPTWFGGTSKSLAGYVGPDKMIDSTRYFVIAVDALGDGISSSPSNSVKQPAAMFPQFNIHDMVRSQYLLITKVFGLTHLHAVIGGSMGGMQTFEWLTSYPDFLDKAIPWVGSPQLTSYDLLLWQAELRAVEMGQQSGSSQQAISRLVATIQTLGIQTPHYRVTHTPRADFPQFIAETDSNFAGIFQPDNWASQLRAMMAHDVSAPFGGKLDSAATAVHARALIIVAAQDHIVNPEPALAFARMIGADTLVLDNDCGHLAVSCEMERVIAAITEFLEK